MRILAVTPYYEPEGGGLERYAHALLTRLASRGHEVNALAFTRRGLAGDQRDGVEIHRFLPRWRLGNTPLHPAFRTHVFDALRKFSPDVVVAHTPVPFAAEMAYLAARRAKIPFVATYHAGRLRGSSHVLDFFAAIDRWTLERQMLAGTSRLIAVSPFVRDHALERYREHVTIVPPGVDAARFRPHGEPDGRSILFVGPLSRSYRWKGVDVLWNAFPRVQQRVPDAKLTLVGEGDRFREFTEKARSTRGAIQVRGRLSEEGLVAEYRRAAVVVLPSLSEAESFGMVLAEANACGRPVVGSRIGGIPDFLRDKDNGLLVRPGDSSDLAEKLVTVLTQPELARRMGRQGRERVLREHNWNHLALATERVLEAAANNHPTPEVVSLGRGTASL